MKRRRAKISVRAVVVDRGRALLALHEHPERAVPIFWCFPGGAVEPGENLKGALKREIAEETGLQIAPGGIVYIQDFVKRNMLDIFMAAELTGGILTLGSDPEPGANHLRDVSWVPIKDLNQKLVLPKQLASYLNTGTPLPTIPFTVI